MSELSRRSSSRVTCPRATPAVDNVVNLVCLAATDSPLCNNYVEYSLETEFNPYLLIGDKGTRVCVNCLPKVAAFPNVEPRNLSSRKPTP